MSDVEKARRPDGDGHAIATVRDPVRSTVELTRLALLVVVVVFLLFKWPVFQALIERINYIKTPWGEAHFDEAAFRRAFRNLPEIRTSPEGNPIKRGTEEIVSSAFKQAQYLAPAIAGASVLWIDPSPANQRVERDLLNQLDINVDVVRTTFEGERRVEEKSYDLIISNVGGPKFDADEAPPLPIRLCPAAFFPGRSQGEDINALPGVVRVEYLAGRDPRLADHHKSRVIFYTASHAERMSDMCARVITNRVDVLIQSVVSALSELRSDRLPAIGK